MFNNTLMILHYHKHNKTQSVDQVMSAQYFLILWFEYYQI